MSSTALASPLLGGAAEAGGVRAALAFVDRHAAELAGALRRGVPFLGRRGVPIAPAPAEAMTLSALAAELAQPSFSVLLATDPGGSRGALFLDAAACAFLLDGALGGDGSQPPTLDPTALSAAQSALIARVAEGVVGAASATLGAIAGFRLLRLPHTPGATPADAPSIALRLGLGDAGSFGTVVLAVGRDALLASGAAMPSARRDAIEPRVAATLEDVELEVVAELGRVRMKLGELSALAVGDVLDLDVPVGGVVKVRAGNRFLLEGHPTTSGTQVAIRVARRHDT
jgi:flagellar motor switch protein FliM